MADLREGPLNTLLVTAPEALSALRVCVPVARYMYRNRRRGCSQSSAAQDSVVAILLAVDEFDAEQLRPRIRRTR